MEKESYEDEATAAIINKNFIPIKVDREERPEVDAYFMSAVQAMTGSGGWPLNVFLTPDLKPFYGGTYFPSVPSYGMPDFKQVLEFVAKMWRERREEVLTNSEQVTKSIAAETVGKSSGELSKELLEGGYASLAATFDPDRGGFGGAPKFPLPLSIAFMLRYHFRTGNQIALRTVTKTLDEMMRGGIRDHLGGGFHRYATDRVWLVPHFEKMLYDNALLAREYLEAFQVTKKQEYAEVARETLAWIMGEMRDSGGGFYSAQDADTSEGEGVFYTWTPGELKMVLGDDAEPFASYYGVTRNGNFEGGRSILHVAGVQPEEGIEKRLRRWKAELLKARLTRPRPATDDKVLTSWNGLAVSALSVAGTVLGEGKYLAAASSGASFVLKTNAKDGYLLRRSVKGEAALEGTLEDYSFFVQGLLDLFDATSEPRWLSEAIRLTDLMIEKFLDGEKGGFFMSEESSVGKVKQDYDGPTPSGNSVAAVNLVRLSELTGEERLKKLASETLKVFAREMDRQPAGHAWMLTGLDLLLNGMKEIVITAPDKGSARAMTKVLAESFLPNKATLVATPANFKELAPLTPLLEGRSPGRTPVAFVCENFTCKLPAKSAAALTAQLAPRAS